MTPASSERRAGPATPGTGGLDLWREPLRYPGPPATGPLLLRVRGAEPLPDGDRGTVEAALARHGATPLAGRVPVVSVGSNCCPEVLWRKVFLPIGRAGDRRAGDHRAGDRVAAVMLPAQVEDLEVAHAAFVSAPGFVPAAPAHRPGARVRVVLTWLDPAQLAAVDRTEPNYARVLLRTPVPAVEGTTSGRGGAGWDGLLGRAEVYSCRWGVLRDGDRPLALTTQEALAVRLAGWGLEPWRSATASGAAARLAADPDLRASARDAFAARNPLWYGLFSR